MFQTVYSDYCSETVIKETLNIQFSFWLVKKNKKACNKKIEWILFLIILFIQNFLKNLKLGVINI